VHKWHQTKPKYYQMFMIIEIIEESLGWRTIIHRGYRIIWSKGQNNENINKNKTTISGIDLHWNYQKHFWFIYIKELLVQKYWQLISTKQLWSVSSKSRTVQYRVPRCPGQYRNVQDRVLRCPSQYRDVQVPRCLGFNAIANATTVSYWRKCSVYSVFSTVSSTHSRPC
jgi:hypothetical protein